MERILVNKNKFSFSFIKADKNVLINRAEVLKWGIKIADVTIFFSK